MNVDQEQSGAFTALLVIIVNSIILTNLCDKVFMCIISVPLTCLYSILQSLRIHSLLDTRAAVS